MKFRRHIALLVLSTAVSVLHAQDKSLPDVSSTIKGNLTLPVPLGIPLFEAATESIGQLDGVIQFPVWKGLGLGAGGKMTWFAINERALAPVVTSGQIRRGTVYGKIAYERYTGERTYYEFNARFGASTYNFECPTCTEDSRRTVFHWGIGTGYYLHATDNLSFGLTIGYEADNTRFSASDLGLESFPGRIETAEDNIFQYFLVGMGFSTRLRRSDDNARGW